MYTDNVKNDGGISMFGIIGGSLGVLVSGALAVSKALVSVGMSIQGLKIIGNAIVSIAKVLGIIKPERDIQDVGDRALQAEEKGMTLDKYPSYEAWLRAIEEDDWGYDPEKNKDMDPEKKILEGIDVTTAVTMEKFPNLPIQDFFTLSANKPEFFTEERMSEIGNLVQNDPDSFGKIVNYVVGSGDRANLKDATSTLIDIEKSISPGISDDAAYDKVASFYNYKK